MAQTWHWLILAGVLLSPSTALADGKDRDKQRRERSVQQPRVHDANGRVYPETFGNDKEWRKDQKERDKDRRKALKERQKDQREAEKEREKNRREAAREYDKDHREAHRDNEKDRREAGKDGRQGNTQRFPRQSTRP